MNRHLQDAAHAKAIDMAKNAGLDKLQTMLSVTYFSLGAIWYHHRVVQETGKDIDPVPAWFGLIPANNDDDEDYSGPFPDKNIGDY